MRLLYTLTAFLLTLTAFAQQGDFLLSDHFPQHPNIDNSNFEIVNDHKGRICVANRAGVLKYDGEAWDFYKTPSAALSLAVDSSDVVYVGCIGSVGIIDFKNRSINYRSLLESDTLKDLFLETHYLKNKVFFLGSSNLIIYNVLTEEKQHYFGEYLNLYELDDEIFLNTVEGETYLVTDSLQKIKPKKLIAYSNKKKGKPDLIIDFDGRLASYSDFEFRELPQNKIIAERGYELKEAQWINDSLFVCSTFESGLLFFNTQKPNEITVSDYHSGLPDNEIYALHTDNSNGVWAAHDFGITQISPLFPAYSYSHFPGLEGNLTSISNHEDQLWVTTSLGLYYFDKDTVYNNQVYYEVAKKTKRVSSTSTSAAKKASSNESSKLSIGRLFGKKNRATQESSPTKIKGVFNSIASVFDGKDNVAKVKGKLDKNVSYVRKVRRIPVDVEYSFQKVSGASGKFITTIPYLNKLLGVSNNGVYEISNKEAEIIIPENVQSFSINKNDQLVISTSSLELKFFKLIGDVWVEQITEPTNDIIVTMKEDSNGFLWLAGSNTLYKTQSTDSTFQVVDQYPLENMFLDQVDLLERNKTLYFINSQGYFYYDQQNETLVEDATLTKQIGKPLHHIYDDQGKSVWVYNGKSWFQLDEAGTINSFEYLGLFPDLRAIVSNAATQDLWMLTKDNDLLKYDPTKDNEIGEFDLFLRKVSNDFGLIDQREKFALSYDENFLSIELSKPDFLGLLNPEFQYKLEGLNTEWSEWSKSKSIDFSFLPEGSYRLLVRSRDAFGREQESEMLTFSVKPPYWQTPWFYAIQILFFGGLVYYSSKLNQDSSKNRLLKSGLTLLTLVLIIEFLQSAIGSLFTFKSTPVVDFLIDAMIAFMIFPLERLLREIMTKGKVSMKVKIKKEDLRLVKKDASAK